MHAYRFQTWLKQLQRSLAQQTLSAKHPFHSDPYYLRSITVQSFDLFGKHRVGFLKLQADVRTADGKGWLPGAVFLRGSSVAVLFVLVPDDSEESSESYVVLTVQPRVAAGSLALSELPAGMVDDEGQFAGTAAKEIQEELGVEVKEDDLVSLTDLAAEAAAAAAQTGEDRKGDSGGDEGLAEALFPSPGACDETMRLYAHVRRVPRAQLQEWQGRLTGLRSEGEKITLKVVPFQDAVWEARRDGKALAALALWEGLRRTGRLPENLLRPR